MDLVTFLRARLDKDEATAESAAAVVATDPGDERLGDNPPWDGRDWYAVPDRKARDEETVCLVVAAASEEMAHWSILRAFVVTDAPDPDTAPVPVHIARHDPARVLREVEAKRRIVDEYERQVQLSEENVRRSVEIGRRGWDDRLTNLRTHGWELSGRVAALKFAVQAQASAYSDHPDYDAEWRL